MPRAELAITGIAQPPFRCRRRRPRRVSREHLQAAAAAPLRDVGLRHHRDRRRRRTVSCRAGGQHGELVAKRAHSTGPFCGDLSAMASLSLSSGWLRRTAVAAVAVGHVGRSHCRAGSSRCRRGLPRATALSRCADLQRHGLRRSRAVAPPGRCLLGDRACCDRLSHSPAWVISTLRGLASSATGIVRVSTPFS